MFAIKTSYLSYLVSFSLLAASIVLNNVGFVYGSVLALLVAAAHETLDKLKSKDIEFKLPEAEKRKIQDMEQRIQTIEFGIKARGF